MRGSSASHPCCLTPPWAFVPFSNVLTTLAGKLSNPQLKKKKLNFCITSLPQMSNRCVHNECGLGSKSMVWFPINIPHSEYRSSQDDRWSCLFFISVLTFQGGFRVEIFRNTRVKDGEFSRQWCPFAFIKDQAV